MLDLAEEAFDEIATSVEERAERRHLDASRHGFDVRPGAAPGEAVSQRVAVVGAIGEQDLRGAQAIGHIAGASAVMRLAPGELEGDRIAVGVDERGSWPSVRRANAPCIGLERRAPGRLPAGPLFDVCRMLMDADRGGVHHLQITFVSLRYCREDPVPDAELAPPDEAVVAGRRRTVPLRDIGPRRAAARRGKSDSSSAKEQS